MSVQPCSECGGSVSSKAKACPHCGAPADTGVSLRTATIISITIVLALIMIPSLFFNGSSSGSNAAPSQDNEGMAWQMTQQFVEERLKSPSTAEFPWSKDVEIKKIGGRYMVDGHVDAQNSFGAMIRRDFRAALRYEPGGDWVLLSLEFDE